MGADNISGSRDSDGNVPNVNWNDDKLNINYYNSDNANENLRARAEVSRWEALYSGFFSVRNCCQRVAILEISWSWPCRSKYIFIVIISNSFINLTSCLSISILIRSFGSKIIFVSLFDKAAAIVKFKQARHSSSIFLPMPNLSCLGNFLFSL